MKFLLVLIIICITLSPAFAKETNIISSSLPLFADQLTNKKLKKMTGVSVSLVDTTGLLWSHHAGVASKKKRQVLSENTAMRMASISKVFTGTALMQLAEDGSIDLDEQDPTPTV